MPEIQEVEQHTSGLMAAAETAGCLGFNLSDTTWIFHNSVVDVVSPAFPAPSLRGYPLLFVWHNYCGEAPEAASEHDHVLFARDSDC